MIRVTSLIALGVLLSLSTSALAQFSSEEDQVERGRELFVHQWEPNDKLSPHGDGLGPLFNAKSCVDCHDQGGIGGSGSNQRNAQMLAVVPEPGEPTARNAKSFLTRLGTMHPEFVDQQGGYFTGVLLHRHSTLPAYAKAHDLVTTPLEETIQSRSRIRRMLKQRGISEISLLPLKLVIYQRDLQYALAERNAPQLFGAHYIDTQIRESDILAIAQQQKRSNHGVSGRFTGRFGWRGQLEDLDIFIKGAAAAELGLQVKEMNQSKDPLQPDYHLQGVDLSAEQAEQLVAYVRSLPRPEQVMPEDPNERSFVNQGSLLFDAIGCAECHVKEVGQLSGVYSDFLLHDMGPEFEDPIPAMKVRPKVSTAMISMPHYYGIDRLTPVEIRTIEEKNHYKEYRTPPLWGVADSAPYLHDGRATSLRAAIEWHGGEALASRAYFAQLSEQEQVAVLKFLGSLRAPQSAEDATAYIAEETPVAASEKISSTDRGTMKSVAARK